MSTAQQDAQILAALARVVDLIMAKDPNMTRTLMDDAQILAALARVHHTTSMTTAQQAILAMDDAQILAALARVVDLIMAKDPNMTQDRATLMALSILTDQRATAEQDMALDWKQPKRSRHRRSKQQQQPHASASTALVVTSAVSDTASQTSSDDQRPHIMQCLQARNSDSGISRAGSDVSMEGIRSARISELPFLIASLQQELESLTALSAPPSEADQTAASAAISNDKEPISVFIKETTQRLDGVDNSIAAFGAQLEVFKTEIKSILSAATQPPMASQASTYASKVSAGLRPPQQTTGKQSSRVASSTNRLAFVMKGCPADFTSLNSGTGLVPGLQSIICERLKLAPGAIKIIGAFPLGKALPQDRRRRYFFRVTTQADADLIVSHRCALKDSQLVISDELSPDERAVHNALWPTFIEARRMGLKSQFNRARLFVSSGASPTKYQVVL